MTPETQPRPLYDVTVHYLAEPADDGEPQNDTPLGIVDAVMLAADTVNDMILTGYRLDGSTPITNSSARQRWHLRRGGLKAVVDVVEVQPFSDLLDEMTLDEKIEASADADHFLKYGKWPSDEEVQS